MEYRDVQSLHDVFPGEETKEHQGCAYALDNKSKKDNVPQNGGNTSVFFLSECIFYHDLPWCQEDETSDNDKGKNKRDKTKTMGAHMKQNHLIRKLVSLSSMLLQRPKNKAKSDINKQNKL